jgi:ribosomal protein L37AE/L43A
MEEKLKCPNCKNDDGNLIDLKYGYWRCWACSHRWKRTE